MDDGRPTTGVVVLSYQARERTAACLAGLSRLAPPPDRIVVVDNGSTDGSAQLVRDAEGVEAVESPVNLGFSGGVNLGLARLLDDGLELVWVLNNDTLVEPSSLGLLVDEMVADPRLGAIGPVFTDPDDPEVVTSWGGGAVYGGGLTREAVKATDRIDYVSGAAMMLRTAALREVGLFDDGLFFTWEDVELSERLRDGGWRIATSRHARVAHVGGDAAPIVSPFRVREHMAGAVHLARRRGWLPRLRVLPLLAHDALVAGRERRLEVLAAALRGWLVGSGDPATRRRAQSRGSRATRSQAPPGNQRR